MNKQLAKWFFERAELLAAAGVFLSPPAGSGNHRRANVFDSTLSPLERWASFNSHHAPALPGGPELIEAVTTRFGAENTIVLDSIPFLYNYLCMLGYAFAFPY